MSVLLSLAIKIEEEEKIVFFKSLLFILMPFVADFIFIFHNWCNNLSGSLFVRGAHKISLVANRKVVFERRQPVSSLIFSDAIKTIKMC